MVSCNVLLIPDLQCIHIIAYRNMQDPIWGDNDEMRPISDIPRAQLEEDGNQLGGADEENYGGIGGI